MRRLLLVLLLAGLGLPAAARADDPPKDAQDAKERQRRIDEAKKAEAEAEKKLIEGINAAIDSGGKWLAKQQAADGTWQGFQPGSRDKRDMGLQALCLMTLVKCGYELHDPEIEKGVKALRGMYDGSGPPAWNFKGTDGITTYNASLVVMFLESLYDPPAPMPKPSERYAQPKKKPCKMPKDIEEIVRYLVNWLVTNRAEGKDVWRYPGGLEGPEDLSNTQYALLALQAAARCGIEVGASVYEKALEYLLDHQAKTGPEVVRWIPNPSYEPGLQSEPGGPQSEGNRYGPFMGGPKDHARGWAYLPGTETWSGSMTTAGIAGLAIVKDRLKALNRLDKDTEKKIDAALVDGCAWLGKEFTVTRNPGGGGWHYYYLYGLERAGAMTGLRWFGKHEWYREGSQYLINVQEPDGGWPAYAGPENTALQFRTVQSCFALLFLRRASVPPSQPIGPVVTSGN